MSNIPTIVGITDTLLRHPARRDACFLRINKKIKEIGFLTRDNKDIDSEIGS